MTMRNLNVEIVVNSRKQETLKRHIETVHVVCEYCGKQFVKKKSLEIHIRGVHFLPNHLFMNFKLNIL